MRRVGVRLSEVVAYESQTAGGTQKNRTTLHQVVAAQEEVVKQWKILKPSC